LFYGGFGAGGRVRRKNGGTAAGAQTPRAKNGGWRPRTGLRQMGGVTACTRAWCWRAAQASTRKKIGGLGRSVGRRIKAGPPTCSLPTDDPRVSSIRYMADDLGGARRSPRSSTAGRTARNTTLNDRRGRNGQWGRWFDLPVRGRVSPAQRPARARHVGGKSRANASGPPICCVVHAASSRARSRSLMNTGRMKKGAKLRVRLAYPTPAAGPAWADVAHGRCWEKKEKKPLRSAVWSGRRFEPAKSRGGVFRSLTAPHRRVRAGSPARTSESHPCLLRGRRYSALGFAGNA